MALAPRALANGTMAAPAALDGRSQQEQRNEFSPSLSQTLLFDILISVAVKSQNV